MISKKYKILLFFSAFCFMSQNLFSMPPEELCDEDLQRIKTNNGIYIRNNKQYGTWAFKPNEQELGVLAQDTLKNISSLEGWKANKLNYEAKNQNTLVKVEETSETYTSVAHNLATYLDIMRAESAAISPTPSFVTCNVEYANPRLNPDINDLLEERSTRAVPVSRSYIYKMWAYRLYDGNGDHVKDFLLLRVGKGVNYIQLKEEANFALELASLE